MLSFVENESAQNFDFSIISYHFEIMIDTRTRSRTRSKVKEKLATSYLKCLNSCYAQFCPKHQYESIVNVAILWKYPRVGIFWLKIQFLDTILIAMKVSGSKLFWVTQLTAGHSAGHNLRYYAFGFFTNGWKFKTTHKWVYFIFEVHTMDSIVYCMISNVSINSFLFGNGILYSHKC